MQSPQHPPKNTPFVVRLGLGTTALVLAFHILFVGLQSLLNVWVALTPKQDLQWNLSRSRA